LKDLIVEDNPVDASKKSEISSIELAVINKGFKNSVSELEHFAFLTSRDLDEPLSMVSNNVRLLKRHFNKKVDTDGDKLIGNAIEGINHMQTMISDLLNFSCVNTTSSPFKPTDCEKVLKQALLELKYDIEKSGAVITHDALPIVIADAPQLVRLLRNRISNAVKFCSAEPARIHISAEQKDNEWVFSISDNGIGCAEYPGSGISTALGTKIIQRHGGRTWIESVPRNSSIFHFTIPIDGDQLH